MIAHCLVITFLYLSQGIVQSIVACTPVFLLRNFPEYITPALIATITLPLYLFSIKFLFAPLIDVLSFGELKYRRISWLLPAQFFTVLVLCILTYVINPNRINKEFIFQGEFNTSERDIFSELSRNKSDELAFINLKLSNSSVFDTSIIHVLCIIYFIISLFASIQDVALDAWAVEGFSNKKYMVNGKDESNQVAIASNLQTAGLMLGQAFSLCFLLLFSNSPKKYTIYKFFLLSTIFVFIATIAAIIYVILYGVPDVEEFNDNSITNESVLIRLKHSYLDIFALCKDKFIYSMILINLTLPLLSGANSVLSTHLSKNRFFTMQDEVLLETFSSIIQVCCVPFCLFIRNPAKCISVFKFLYKSMPYLCIFNIILYFILSYSINQRKEIIDIMNMTHNNSTLVEVTFFSTITYQLYHFYYIIGLIITIIFGGVMFNVHSGLISIISQKYPLQNASTLSLLYATKNLGRSLPGSLCLYSIQYLSIFSLKGYDLNINLFIQSTLNNLLEYSFSISWVNYLYQYINIFTLEKAIDIDTQTKLIPFSAFMLNEFMNNHFFLLFAICFIIWKIAGYFITIPLLNYLEVYINDTYSTTDIMIKEVIEEKHISDIVPRKNKRGITPNRNKKCK